MDQNWPISSIRRYGDKNLTNNCLRIKNPERKNKRIKHRVRPYESAFIARRGYRIAAGRCHSHRCGNPRSKHSFCINGRHILEQSQAANNKRKRHHNLIKKYEREFRRKYPGKRTMGPLYVADILEFVDPESEEYTECDCEGGRCFINYGLREKRKSKRKKR